MTPERYSQVKKLFQLVLEQQAHDRAAFLNEACGEDRELYQQVRDLLKADFTSKQFLEKPAITPISKVLQEAAAAAEADETPPARIGPYAVDRLIGTGGMGAVYLASRADGAYSKEVAIKVIRTGMETEKILQRFRRERDIVASLDHPNIARLLDGGATADGRPYIVMEYVEGIPIDTWCDQRRLNTEQRLRLFLQVCEAIHYAHQNLIVHRDIKPGNILVRGDGRVKLLDFGIAKILNPDMDAAAAEKTATSMRLMTPQYASPEQVKGESVTTSSDVYLLGIVLFELLTGHRPYEVRDNATLEVIRAFAQGEPSKPSDAIFRIDSEWTDQGGRRVVRSANTISVTRDGTPAALVKKLRGDVDAIVLKALRRNPAHRYASTVQLADDIRNHLDSLPVSAREYSTPYRISLLLRRNTGLTLAAGAALLLLVFLAIVAVWQASQARTERLRAQARMEEIGKMSKALLHDVYDSLAPIAGTAPARKLLIARSLDTLSRLSRAGDSPPQELAAGYLRLGDLQIHVGDKAGAAASYGNSRTILEQLLQSAPKNAPVLSDLASALEASAALDATAGDSAAAIAHLRKAADIREQVAGQPAARSAGLFQLASALALTGANQEAVGLARKAYGFVESVSGPDAIRHQAIGHDRLATLLHRTGDREGAVTHARQAVSLLQGAGSKAEFAAALENLAAIEETAAAESFRRALQIRRELAASAPGNVAHKRDLAHLLLKQGSFDDAIESFGQIAILNPDSHTAAEDLTLAWISRGEAHDKSGKTDLAANAYRQALESARDEGSRRLMGKAHAKLAEVLVRAGDRPGALGSARFALQILNGLLERDKENLLLQRDRAAAHWVLGRILVESAAAGSQAALWRDAEAELLRAQEQFAALANRKQLTGEDRAAPEAIAADLERCRQRAAL